MAFHFTIDIENSVKFHFNAITIPVYIYNYTTLTYAGIITHRYTECMKKNGVVDLNKSFAHKSIK